MGGGASKNPPQETQKSTDLETKDGKKELEQDFCEGDVGFAERTTPQESECFYDEHSSEGNISPRQSNDAEMFSVTAMSLGMENDDLLFNLLYFGGNEHASFGNMMNSAMEETVALHSEGNTPYRLCPASEDALEQMKRVMLTSRSDSSDIECAVCKDEMDINSEIIRLPNCKHYFHSECIMRWLKMQGCCPVCRDKIQRGTDQMIVGGHQMNSLPEGYRRSPRSQFESPSASPRCSQISPRFCPQSQLEAGMLIPDSSPFFFYSVGR